MKERPILFSGEMVQAILAGKKTQTRRVVKPQPHMVNFGDHDSLAWESPTCINGYHAVGVERVMETPEFLKGPYGFAGDRLWVRETHSLVPCSAGCEKYPDGFDPKRSSASQPNAPGYGVRYKATWDRCHSASWKPSIHMPRWASRITLEITGVRVERLQAISEADAIAEGIGDKERKACMSPDGFVRCDWPQWSYRQLWDQVNGKNHPWESSPWVWVISFRRMESK